MQFFHIESDKEASGLYVSNARTSSSEIVTRMASCRSTPADGVWCTKTSSSRLPGRVTPERKVKRKKDTKCFDSTDSHTPKFHKVKLEPPQCATLRTSEWTEYLQREKTLSVANRSPRKILKCINNPTSSKRLLSKSPSSRGTSVTSKTERAVGITSYLCCVAQNVASAVFGQYTVTTPALETHAKSISQPLRRLQQFPLLSFLSSKKSGITQVALVTLFIVVGLLIA